MYGFARQSGGFVEIDSLVGLGTQVDLYLPVAHVTGELLSKPFTEESLARAVRQVLDAGGGAPATVH